MPDVRLGGDVLLCHGPLIGHEVSKVTCKWPEACRASRGDACLMRGRVDRRGASRFSDKHQERKEDLSMHELRGMP
jgi:hypothetical protein